MQSRETRSFLGKSKHLFIQFTMIPSVEIEKRNALVQVCLLLTQEAVTRYSIFCAAWETPNIFCTRQKSFYFLRE